jgi:hypothetical protein
MVRFHPALTSLLGLTLIGYQVVQVREPRQKRLLTATWANRVRTLWLFVVFGDSGLLQHSCYERVGGEKLENP